MEHEAQNERRRDGNNNNNKWKKKKKKKRTEEREKKRQRDEAAYQTSVGWMSADVGVGCFGAVCVVIVMIRITKTTKQQ